MKDSISSGIVSPKYVGGYKITGKGPEEWPSITCMFVKKPNRVHRLFSKVLLGWVWVDGSILQ